MKKRTKTMARLRVLASGSGGNCSLLVTADGHRILIDAGLSPRRTRLLLDENGLQLSDIDAVLLTHLDSDHFNTGWRNTLPDSIRLCLHQRHANHAHKIGFHHANTHVFTDPFDLFDSVHVDPLLLSHDQLGVTAFRLTFSHDGQLEAPPAHLGFATDLGKITPRLIERFQGIDVLAIESNYCPRMQTQSDRPEFLKRRIMGGAGHLSNQESKQAVEAIAPREHVVFLHLSRQCNCPDLVADLHAHEHYAFTIAEQFTPTRWVSIGADVADTATAVSDSAAIDSRPPSAAELNAR